MENKTARKRKQVPEGYRVIGIDPHKKRHDTGTGELSAVVAAASYSDGNACAGCYTDRIVDQ